MSSREKETRQLSYIESVKNLSKKISIFNVCYFLTIPVMKIQSYT